MSIHIVYINQNQDQIPKCIFQLQKSFQKLHAVCWQNWMLKYKIGAQNTF